MKAWVLHGVGDIRMEDVRKPSLDKNEVCVRVKAAGVCGSDIPRIYETGAHRMPLIPGHEFSGVIDEVGKDVSPYWLGKRVAVYPRIPCGGCRECRNGFPELCQCYDYIGSRRDGAFAEYVAVPQENILELPDCVGFAEAALMEPFAVAANAVRTGLGETENVSASERPVAVDGLGTIGLMAVMLLKDAGCRNIWVIGNKESQRRRAESVGIPGDHYLDGRAGNISERLKEASGGGVSAFYECVGRNECVACGIEAAAPGGRLILVGNPYSDMFFPKGTYWQILRKQLAVSGIWNSSFKRTSHEQDEKPDDWHYILSKVAQGKLHPQELVSHRFGLHDLETGLHIMRDKTEDCCKVMVNME